MKNNCRKMFKYKVPLWILETLILLLLLLPLLSVAILCMSLIRLAVSVLAKLFRKDLHSLVSGRSSGFALDIYYHYDTPTLPIVVTLYLNGQLSLETLQRQVCKVLQIDEECGDGGKLRPTQAIQHDHRLTQYVSSWLGLFFWKTDPHFLIQNHVHMIHQPSSSQSELEEFINLLQNELIRKPFKKCQSPWELLIIRSNTNTNSALILHTHHVLGDGHSILNFLVNDLSSISGRSPIIQMKPKTIVNAKHSSTTTRLKKLFIFPIRAAYEIVKTFGDAGAQILINSNSSFSQSTAITNECSNRKSNCNSDSNSYNYVSKQFSWSLFNQIRQTHQVTFTSILLSSLSGAIRNVLLETEVKIPEIITCFTLLPFPNHEEGFSNHMTGCIIKLPLSNLSPLARLKAIDRNVRDAKSSTFPTIFFYLTELIGLPFHWITKHFFGSALSTLIASNFIGPSKIINFQGIPVNACTFIAGFGSANVSFGVTSLSYAGSISIGVSLNKTILPQILSASTLIEKIENELRLLSEI